MEEYTRLEQDWIATAEQLQEELAGKGARLSREETIRRDKTLKRLRKRSVSCSRM